MAFLGFGVAVAASLAVGWLAIVLGKRLGFVDRPDDGLKPHEGSPVPLGGVGVLVGLHVGMVVSGLFDPGLLLATLLIWTVGLYDDMRSISPWLRLAAAGAAGVVLVATTEHVVWPIAWVVVVMVAVNSINLLDGLDALAGSVTTVAALGLGWFALVQGVADPWAATMLSGALLGFLFWNLPPARLFLGDNGAYAVGVALAWAAMRASPGRSAALVAVALIGVPILDLAVTVVRRVLSRAELFAGDRDHTYDRLHQLGMSAGVVAILFAGAQLLWMAGLVTVSAQAGIRSAVVTAALGGAVIVALASMMLVRSRPE